MAPWQNLRPSTLRTCTSSRSRESERSTIGVPTFEISVNIHLLKSIRGPTSSFLLPFFPPPWRKHKQVCISVAIVSYTLLFSHYHTVTKSKTATKDATDKKTRRPAKSGKSRPKFVVCIPSSHTSLLSFPRIQIKRINRNANRRRIKCS